MDTVGNKGAHTEIQAIKIATPAHRRSGSSTRRSRSTAPAGSPRTSRLPTCTPASARCGSPTGPTRCTRTPWRRTRSGASRRSGRPSCDDKPRVAKGARHDHGQDGPPAQVAAGPRLHAARLAEGGRAHQPDPVRGAQSRDFRRASPSRVRGRREPVRACVPPQRRAGALHGRRRSGDSRRRPIWRSRPTETWASLRPVTTSSSVACSCRGRSTWRRGSSSALQGTTSHLRC